MDGFAPRRSRLDQGNSFTRQDLDIQYNPSSQTIRGILAYSDRTLLVLTKLANHSVFLDTEDKNNAKVYLRATLLLCPNFYHGDYSAIFAGNRLVTLIYFLIFLLFTLFLKQLVFFTSKNLTFCICDVAVKYKF